MDRATGLLVESIYISHIGYIYMKIHCKKILLLSIVQYDKNQCTDTILQYIAIIHIYGVQQDKHNVLE